ncbi:hypothetical protein EI94DRAFT_1819666 [Lactarius quietus]|nr:hypothetical protein EI94DRAFT_1819666 [Lactarius quietus]
MSVTGYLTSEERDTAFWAGFHPDDRSTLQPHSLKSPLHFEDVFMSARTAFMYEPPQLHQLKLPEPDFKRKLHANELGPLTSDSIRHPIPIPAPIPSPARHFNDPGEGDLHLHQVDLGPLIRMSPPISPPSPSRPIRPFTCPPSLPNSLHFQSPSLPQSKSPSCLPLPPSCLPTQLLPQSLVDAMSSPSPLPSCSIPLPIHSQLLPDFMLILSTEPLPPLDPTSLSSPPCLVPPSASPSPPYDSLQIPLLSHSPELPLSSFGAISLPRSSSLPSDWPPAPSPSPPVLVHTALLRFPAVLLVSTHRPLDHSLQAPYDFPPPLTFPLSPPPRPPDAAPASLAKPHATSPPSSPSPSSSRVSPFQLLDSMIMSLPSPVESQPPPPTFLDSMFVSPHGFPPPVVTPLSTSPWPPNVMPPNVADAHSHLPPPSPHLPAPSFHSRHHLDHPTACQLSQQSHVHHPNHFRRSPMLSPQNTRIQDLHHGSRSNFETTSTISSGATTNTNTPSHHLSLAASPTAATGFLSREDRAAVHDLPSQVPQPHATAVSSTN